MAGEFTGGAVARVGVVGLGTMGAGIVEVFARGGIEVVAVEIDEEALERGRATLRRSTDRAVARGRLAASERDALVDRISFAVGLAALRDVDLVVEAVPERLDLKRRLFAELDDVCQPGAILATNTSSLSVTEIAVATRRPERVVGMHFFNPAPVMKLVEVIRTVVTAPDVVDTVAALCARLGKVGVTIGDRAGFIANALLFGYLNQAIELLDAGHASREDIDAAMKLGCGLPMGPFTLLDLIGLDTALEILETMYRRGGRSRRHAPAPLLRQMVTAGLLGRKSGAGFYRYVAPGSPEVVPDGDTPAEPATAPRPVERIGIVGSGAPADAIARYVDQAGGQVLRVAWSGGAPSGLDALADVDLVVVVGGDAEAQRELFARLGQVCPAALLAAATPALPVIELAMASGRPADVLGLRFRDPMPETPLVEIVRTVRTSAEAVATGRALCARLGWTGVRCSDRAGFVVDALLVPYLNDAVRMLEASYATVDDIDNAMKLGCGYPMGPFEQLDAIGLDVALDLQRRIYQEVREPGLAPAPLLEQLVTAGRLGRSTGHGFREHPGR